MLTDYSAHLTVLPSKLALTQKPSKEELDKAYDYCLDLFKLHAKSFHFASRYLNDEERRAIAALYGFCRLADDFADEMNLPKEQIEHELDVLTEITNQLAAEEVFEHPLFMAFGDTMVRYNIPLKYLHELIEGVRMDINLTNIKTVQELDKYCYHVASTVGILMCHIWGATDPETLERAADLGHALQLTNILRDIAEDYDNGRIYLPEETRVLFRVENGEFEDRTLSPNFRLLIENQIARARSIYAQAAVGYPDLPPAAAFTVKVAGRVYAEIMTEIEKMDYQIWKKRAVVPKWRKLLIAYQCRKEYKHDMKLWEKARI